MSETTLVSIGGGIFLLIIILVMYFAFKGTSNTKASKSGKKTASQNRVKTEALTLDELIDAANASDSNAQLSKLCMSFINSEVLPIKRTAKLSSDANHKLSFVSAVCANKAADAKTIAFLVQELEKRYPSYAQELEMFQNMGLARRKMRH